MPLPIKKHQSYLRILANVSGPYPYRVRLEARRIQDAVKVLGRQVRYVMAPVDAYLTPIITTEQMLTFQPLMSRTQKQAEGQVFNFRTAYSVGPAKTLNFPWYEVMLVDEQQDPQ